MLIDSLLLFRRLRKRASKIRATVSPTNTAKRLALLNTHILNTPLNTSHLNTVNNDYEEEDKNRPSMPNKNSSESKNDASAATKHRMTFSPGNLNGLSFNIGGTLQRRRFSETYYNSLDHQKRPRLVKKCGELNIHMENVPKHKRRLLSDIFNTILDIKWRWHVVIFILSFMVSWFIFATVWYMIGKLQNLRTLEI
jgi:hypothetical protein